MTQHFFTFIYGWAGFWLLFCVILLVSRRNKEVPDYEIIGFRESVSFVCLAVFIRRWLHFPYEILIPPLTIFGWTSMMNTIRVAQTIYEERRRNGTRPE